MKKELKTKFGVMVAALLSVSASQSKAESDVTPSGYQNLTIQEDLVEKFTPYEDLTAEERLIYLNALDELANNESVDLENSIIGVDQKGNLVVKSLQNPSETRVFQVVKPTCGGGFSSL
jgi:hypothetical protein